MVESQVIGVRIRIDASGISALLTEIQNRNATLKAVRSGVKIINSAAKSYAPKKLGHLKRAQGIKAKKGRRGKTGSFAVQGAKTAYVKMKRTGRRGATAMVRVVPAFYDHLVIGGVQPHSIRRGSKVARKGKSAVVVEGQRTGMPHPGARANSYRLRAYNSVKNQVGAEVLRVLGIETDKIIAKADAKLRAKGK